MRKKTLIFFGGAFIFFFACNQVEQKDTKESSETTATDSVFEQAKTLFQPIVKNEITDSLKAKIKLGHALYFDKRLSKNNTISCNSCHNLSSFGVDNLPTSPGDAGKNGDRNSPTVLNVAMHTSQFWDGRAKDVEEQAGMPILNPIEMAIPNEKFLIDRLSKIAGYKQLFSEAFPSDKTPLTYENLKKAIGAFERQLSTPSKFDDYLTGNKEALNDIEKKGLNTFIKTGCNTCHTGSLLGGTMFQKFGLYGNYWEYTKSKTKDEGRYQITKNEADKYVFKVPSLRNISKTQPYFHDGSVEKLEDAVKIMAKINLNKELSEEDTQSIVAFLNTLTGEIPKELSTQPAMPQ